MRPMILACVLCLLAAAPGRADAATTAASPVWNAVYELTLARGDVNRWRVRKTTVLTEGEPRVEDVGVFRITLAMRTLAPDYYELTLTILDPLRPAERGPRVHVYTGRAGASLDLAAEEDGLALTGSMLATAARR